MPLRASHNVVLIYFRSMRPFTFKNIFMKTGGKIAIQKIPERERQIYRVTLTGSVVNFFLVIFKFIAGILGNSSAMVADAVHSLSDFISDIILIICTRIASRPEDADHAYGHGKFETLASVAVGLMLFLTGAAFLGDGISVIMAYFRGGSLARPGWLALFAAILSIGIKEWLYRYTRMASDKTESKALQANAWHHRSDALSSLATLIGIGGAIIPGEQWQILDPCAACVISIFIIGMSFALMKPGIDELMEKSLPAQKIEKIIDIINSTPGVLAYHRLRTRRMGIKCAIEAHVKLHPSLTLKEAHDIASLVEKRLKEHLGADTHVGIHMEPARETEIKANFPHR